MSFLKKLGGLLSTITAIFTGFAPILQKEVPQTGGVLQVVSKDLAAVADAVVSAEAIGNLQGLSGADKAKALGPIVAQIVLNSTIVAGKKIGDPTLFAQGCQNLGGAVADILNSIHQDSVGTVTASVPK